MPRLLLIDDDRFLLRAIEKLLTAEGYYCMTVVSADEARRALTGDPFDMVIMDVGLPDQDGFALCRQVRARHRMPILFLTARDESSDKVIGLEVGADDYLTKPFGVGELMARIRVTLRHGARSKGPEPDPLFEHGDLRVDLAVRRVFVRGAEVHLTPTEFKLLGMLVRHAGMVLTHKQLLREVWGPAYSDETHYLRVYMGQLRHKIELDPARPRHITTEPGVGYRLLTE